MNSSELSILRNGQLSHAARLVYTLALIPSAVNGKVKPDYNIITSAIYIAPSMEITSEEQGGYNPDFSEINQLILELIAARLLEPDEECEYENYYNGIRLRLPLRQGVTQATHNLYTMNIEWRPDENFEQTARLCGLIDFRYSLVELNEFIAYWSASGKAQDSHHWNMSFIKYLKRIHI